MTQAFSPTEIFKRATAATLRAIAEHDDVNVGFGPEPPGLSGKRVKLPNPARDLPADEAAQLRGAADSLALAAALSRRRGAFEARCPATRWRARFSRRWSRRGARPWAPAAWPGSPPI